MERKKSRFLLIESNCAGFIFVNFLKYYLRLTRYHAPSHSATLGLQPALGGGGEGGPGASASEERRRRRRRRRRDALWGIGAKARGRRRDLGGPRCFARFHVGWKLERVFFRRRRLSTIHSRPGVPFLLFAHSRKKEEIA